MVADKKTYIVEYDLRKKGDGAAKAAKETEKLRKETDKLGDTFEDVAKDAKTLDEKLEIYTKHRLELARQLSEEDDVQLRKEFNRTNQRIGFLTKLQKVISAGADAGGAAASAGGKATSGLGGSLSGIGMPTALVGGGALVAGAAPLLGAMLGGALSGTVVGAAMAGGILSAIKEPAVKSAAEQFGERVSQEFFSGGKNFVLPIVQSLDILGDAVEDMNLGEAFAKVAPQVTVVADGIGRMGKNLVSGLNPTLDRSAAFSKEFADGMADLGAALSRSIDLMSSSEGSLEGLNALFKLVNGTLIVVGMTVNALADTFDAFTDIGAKVTGALEDLPEPLQVAFFGHAGFAAANDIFEDLNKSTFDVAGGFARTTGELAGMGAAAAEANRELELLESTVTRMVSEHFELEEAQDALAESTARLKEQIKKQHEEHAKGAGSLTGNTQAARDNREAVRGLAEDYARVLVELQQAGKATGDAEQEFADLLVSMGFSRKEAEKYAESLRKLQEELAKIKSKEVTLTVRTQSIETFKRTNGAGGRNVIEGRAAGGPVLEGVPYRINERGMETVTFPANGVVSPANLSPVPTGRQQIEVIMRTDPSRMSGSSLISALLEAIRYEVRINGQAVLGLS